MDTSVILVIPVLISLSLLGLLCLRSTVRRVIPTLAFVIASLCGLGFLGGLTYGSGNLWFGFAVGASAAAFVLSLGYVYGDAARRGMSPVLWTLTALLAPNLLGFLLYFLLRKHLGEPGLQCEQGIAAGQA